MRWEVLAKAFLSKNARCSAIELTSSGGKRSRRVNVVLGVEERSKSDRLENWTASRPTSLDCVMLHLVSIILVQTELWYTYVEGSILGSLGLTTG